MIKGITFFSGLLVTGLIFGQTTITVFPDVIQSPVSNAFQPGVFYVPKTAEAQADFLSNGIRQNAIRLNIIEGAMNNTSNLNDCLLYLDNVSATLQSLSAKTDKLLFIFEKMPAWLSSSSDGSPAATPGWFVLNTKPPASWTNWTNAITAITQRIVNNYGIDNAYFEIWNEPDLGSWTGTKEAYFELYRRTYDAIKIVDAQLPVGGPATNFWGNNIGFEPPFGYIPNQVADASLIGELIDSTVNWNRPMDFISWHNFNLTYQNHSNAIEYLTQKYASLSMSLPELMISEWNTPSVVRDTPLQKAYFVKNQLELSTTIVANTMVAAWQDFSQSVNEFHNDYGLLSYGSIHKPAYNALLLSNELRGNSLGVNSSAPTAVASSLSGDTLTVLISNYVPPAFVEAFYHTLFEGQLTVSQLDSANVISIATGDVSTLDSIYRELLTIPNSSSVNMAINASIPIYAHYDSLQLSERSFSLAINGISTSHIGEMIRIDSTQNNLQFVYDSLLNAGSTQASAISSITSDQDLVTESCSIVNGTMSFSMEPNGVLLLRFVIPGLASVSEERSKHAVLVYPNPTATSVYMRAKEPIGRIRLLNPEGKLLNELSTAESELELDFSNYPPGVYSIHFVDLHGVQKVIKR